MGDSERASYVQAKLEELVHLMADGKDQLKKLGFKEESIEFHVLYKLAYSASEGGRLEEYFVRKDAEEASKKKAPYQNRNQGGGYTQYEPRQRRY